ncbi:uncharacterized protein At5g48480 [Dendrobium catenatum]|uniref:VOC domain-containing protein n=1 Tax=Dendrobium catenatum TaxID=906689 RepID=A0A2I0WFJ9_9ASPA|nr:uncharacterized protein At5g48480 [Dendrobium catenatum]PKU74429.1 Uncharacterized protein MA16_Dca003632 [Dendrobium catenatum]
MANEGAANTEHINGDSGKAVSLASFKAQLVLPESKANEAVKFYKAAFGAEELVRVNHSKRKAEQDVPLIIFAELKISNNSFLVSDQTDDFVNALDGGGCGIVFRLETEDVAGLVAKAVEAGAVADGEITEMDDAYGGGLLGKLKDPFGILWFVASATKKSCEAES